jgi:hypothetical protein
VSLEASSACVVDGKGNIACEAGSAVNRTLWLHGQGLKLEPARIGLEAGPLSQSLCSDAPSGD